MINAGMKKGDKFTDGGIQYVVEEALPDGNYISKRAYHVFEEQEEVQEEYEESTEEVETAVSVTGPLKSRVDPLLNADILFET